MSREDTGMIQVRYCRIKGDFKGGWGGFGFADTTGKSFCAGF